MEEVEICYRSNPNERGIVCEARIFDFINYAYRPKIESSPDSQYKLNYVYDKEILGVVWTLTSKFDKTIPLAFSQWLNKQKVDFLSDEPERKIKDGYIIVGYCRKSKTSSGNRVTLLQRMKKVVVSPFQQHLNDTDTLLSELSEVNGNIQDFLTFIQDNDKVCVVALDYTGFTTNMSDFKNILNQHSINKDC
ncbi:hypothetical protein AB4K20DRAFT_1970188 [Rhizopus microsporus]